MKRKGTDSITLSPKHGVNPSMGLCFWCGKEDGTVVLPGRLKGDVEAPRKAVWTLEPCADCKKTMALGIHIWEIEDDHTPTGAWWIVTEEAVNRWFDNEAAKDVIKSRKCGVTKDVVKALNLRERTDAMAEEQPQAQ